MTKATEEFVCAIEHLIRLHRPKVLVMDADAIAKCMSFLAEIGFPCHGELTSFMGVEVWPLTSQFSACNTNGHSESLVVMAGAGQLTTCSTASQLKEVEWLVAK